MNWKEIIYAAWRLPVIPWAARKSLSSRELENIPLIACNPLNAPQAMAAFQQQFLTSHPANKVFYCEDLETAHCMVAAGIGLSVLPDTLCIKSPDFAAVPLEEAPELSFGIFIAPKAPTGLRGLLKAYLASANIFFRLPATGNRRQQEGLTAADKGIVHDSHHGCGGDLGNKTGDPQGSHCFYQRELRIKEM